MFRNLKTKQRDITDGQLELFLLEHGPSTVYRISHDKGWTTGKTQRAMERLKGRSVVRLQREDVKGGRSRKYWELVPPEALMQVML